MNKREMHVVQNEATRFMYGSKMLGVADVSNSVRVEIPLLGFDGKPLYFYVVRRAKDGRFSLILPTESIGILPIDTTLSILQKILKTYGLLLSQEAVIMEENIAISLHKRMATMAQAIIAIDGIRRLWKTESDRRNNASKSETT